MIYDDLKLGDIEGWLTDAEAEWLYEAAKKARSVVEIGTHEGRSACAILAGCPKLACVDPFDARGTCVAGKSDHRTILENFRRNIKSRGLPDPEVFVCLSGDGARTFFKDGSVDLLFIDGDHSEEGVATDLRVWAGAVKPGGIVCGHDYGDPDREGLARSVRAYCGGEPERGAGSIWWRRVK